MTYADRLAANPWLAWYGTTRWRRLRDDHIKQNRLCVRCMAEARVELATVVDHVVPHRGDPDLFWTGELQSLCANHHSAAKQSEEARGFSTAIDAAGYPLDPRHPANAPYKPQRRPLSARPSTRYGTAR